MEMHVRGACALQRVSTDTCSNNVFAQRGRPLYKVTLNGDLSRWHRADNQLGRQKLRKNPPGTGEQTHETI